MTIDIANLRRLLVHLDHWGPWSSANLLEATRKSWPELLDEVERLRDEVETLTGMEAQRDACEAARVAAEADVERLRTEIARMREIESDELRDARDAMLRDATELADLRAYRDRTEAALRNLCGGVGKMHIAISNSLQDLGLWRDAKETP